MLWYPLQLAVLSTTEAMEFKTICSISYVHCPTKNWTIIQLGLIIDLIIIRFIIIKSMGLIWVFDWPILNS